MTFQNRREAADILAALLLPMVHGRPLVLGLPPGGVPMARVIAEHLDGDFDVVLVGGLSAPADPDLEVGSVDEEGHAYINDVPRQEGIGREYLGHEKDRQLAALKAHRLFYTPGRPPADPHHRAVILVADTMATEAPLTAAIRSTRLRGADTVLVAAAAAPVDVIEHLENEADEVVCFAVTSPLMTLDQVFADRTSVGELDVVAALTPLGAGTAR